MTEQHSITGRDGYIIAQALYEFIKVQQSLPKDRRQWSNMQDAKAILNAMGGSLVSVFVDGDLRMGRTRPTSWTRRCTAWTQSAPRPRVKVTGSWARS